MLIVQHPDTNDVYDEISIVVKEDGNIIHTDLNNSIDKTYNALPVLASNGKDLTLEIERVFKKGTISNETIVIPFHDTNYAMYDWKGAKDIYTRSENSSYVDYTSYQIYDTGITHIILLKGEGKQMVITGSGYSIRYYKNTVPFTVEEEYVWATVDGVSTGVYVHRIISTNILVPPTVPPNEEVVLDMTAYGHYLLVYSNGELVDRVEMVDNKLVVPVTYINPNAYITIEVYDNESDNNMLYRESFRVDYLLGTGIVDNNPTVFKKSVWTRTIVGNRFDSYRNILETDDLQYTITKSSFSARQIGIPTAYKGSTFSHRYSDNSVIYFKDGKLTLLDGRNSLKTSLYADVTEMVNGLFFAGKKIIYRKDNSLITLTTSFDMTGFKPLVNDRGYILYYGNNKYMIGLDLVTLKDYVAGDIVGEAPTNVRYTCTDIQGHPILVTDTGVYQFIDIDNTFKFITTIGYPPTGLYKLGNDIVITHVSTITILRNY